LLGTMSDAFTVAPAVVYFPIRKEPEASPT
jgi:hypothetical protein